MAYFPESEIMMMMMMMYNFVDESQLIPESLIRTVNSSHKT
jgi:hypothetical protein